MIVELAGAAVIFAVMAGLVLMVLTIGAALGAVPATTAVPPTPPAPSPTPPVPVPREAQAADPPLPPNVFDVDGRLYLRVVTGAGTMVHLAPRAPAASPVAGRRALGARHAREAPGLSGYDDALMRLPVWNLRTMCGLGWTAMASQRAELDAVIARLDAVARAAAGTAYVCPVCASRVPGRPVSR